MWYLIVHRWVGDPQEALNSSSDDHLSGLREQERAGKLLISGPSPDRSVGLSSSAIWRARTSSTNCAARNHSSLAAAANAKRSPGTSTSCWA